MAQLCYWSSGLSILQPELLRCWSLLLCSSSLPCWRSPTTRGHEYDRSVWGELAPGNQPAWMRVMCPEPGSAHRLDLEVEAEVWCAPHPQGARVAQASPDTHLHRGAAFRDGASAWVPTPGRSRGPPG